MKTNLLLTLLVALLMVSCSEHTNDSKYRSDCPRFAALQSSVDEIHVNEPVIFTAVERSAGKLINLATYTWSVLPAENVSIDATSAENGLYDGKNPTATIIFRAKGTYTLTFRADYAGSGQVNYFDISETLSDGPKARYSANTASETSPQRDYLHAVLTRTVRVLE